jgi:hypothetical protein
MLCGDFLTHIVVELYLQQEEQIETVKIAIVTPSIQVPAKGNVTEAVFDPRTREFPRQRPPILPNSIFYIGVIPRTDVSLRIYAMNKINVR